MFRPDCRAIFRLIFEEVQLYNAPLQRLAYNCTPHLFKDQPEDDPTIGPKRVVAIII